MKIKEISAAEKISNSLPGLLLSSNTLAIKLSYLKTLTES